MSDLNDPRVFFAAERTLMAWNRTAITLMAFGFVLERFGLFLQMFRHISPAPARDASFGLGLGFIALAVVVLVFSVWQYRRVLADLRPSEIPDRVMVWPGVAMNLVVAALGVALMVYLGNTL